VGIDKIEDFVGVNSVEELADRAQIGTSGAYGSTIRRMLRFVRFLLLVVMTFLALGLVIAVGTPETGPLEKAVAALAIVAVVAAAGPVRRIGSAS
jgi:hypothetical protein